MPNTKRLMREGSLNYAMPSLPAYTPTNWATIATGAYPGAHGAGNWNDRAPSDPPGRKGLSTFDSRAIQAESIWEAAERAGLKSLVIGYPGSSPSRLKKGYVVAPLPHGLVSLVILPGCTYSTFPAPGKTHAVALKEARGWKNVGKRRALETQIIVSEDAAMAGRGRAQAAKRAKAVGDTEDGADLEVAAMSGKTARVKSDPSRIVFHVLIENSRGRGFDMVHICETKDVSKAIATLKPGEWSDWIVKRIRAQGKTQPASMRFKLMDLSKDGRKFRLLRSEVYPTRGFTTPASLSADLVKNVGPYFEHAALAHGGDFDNYNRSVYEEIDYQVDWHIKAAEYIDRTRGWDIYYSHWHFTDSIEHTFLSPADPESPNYDPKTAKKCLDVLRKGFQLGDKMLGGLWKVGGRDCHIVLVSDHGNASNFYGCNLLRRLEERGLLKHNRKGGIDWKRTRAYPHGGAQVCVNLKGREAHGSVSAKDFASVQEQIIDALLDWKEPKTGKRAVAFALKKKDAPLIGYWGERTGDVFFIYNAGFAWQNPKEGSIGPSPGGANHGPQIPTSGTEFSSVLAVFGIAGPRIKKGYVRDTNRMGYIHLVDLVPTLCHILGIDPPAQSQGAVLHDLLK
ncbi:MAG: hypothetical protein GXP25_00275 [Planctomycetes bacterium]|nr:hypothetical protein [Planctomycetota bacterium]